MRIKRSCNQRISGDACEHEHQEGNAAQAINRCQKTLTIKPDFKEAGQQLKNLGINTEQIKNTASSGLPGDTDIEIDSGEPQFLCKQESIFFSNSKVIRRCLYLGVPNICTFYIIS